MRKVVSGLMFGAAVALLAPVAAHAAALSPAASSLTLVVAGTNASFPANLTATGNAGSNLTASCGAACFGPGKVTVKPSNTATIKKIIVSIKANTAAGHFAGTTPGNVHGVMLITGLAKLRGAVSLNLPVGIGKAGTKNATAFTGSGAVALGITAIGASWQAGVAKITGGGKATPKGAKTVTVAGKNNLTPGGAGSLTLVAPGKVYTTIGADAFIPSPAFMTLTFVPEPGTLLLLGSGIAGLALIGRKRASP